MRTPKTEMQFRYFMLFSGIVLGHELIDLIHAYSSPQPFYFGFCLSRALVVATLWLLIQSKFKL